MKLSVVIISWNSRALLQRCVQSIDSLLRRPDTELVWVDNGSADGSYDMMQSMCGDSTLIRLDANYGVAYARNRGIEAAKGEYVLLLDDDTLATETEIMRLVDYMDANPDVGISAPALWNQEHQLQQSFKRFPGIGVKVANVLRGFSGRQNQAVLPDHEIEPCYVIGACQMIRRKVFDDCGLLDQRIFYGPEDADMCLRAKKHGWRVVYIPSISVIHLWRRITRRNIFSPVGRKHMSALAYFYCKYRRFW